MSEEFWGELRSLCAKKPFDFVVESIAHHIHTSGLPEEERATAIEHAAATLLEWPEAERRMARIPYVPWLLELCERMLEAEARGDGAAFEAAARLVHTFKPDALPLTAARRRQELRASAREEGWRAVAGLALESAPETPEELSRHIEWLDAKDTLLQKAEIIDRDGQGEFKYVLISRNGALERLCALQVLWEVMPEEVRQEVGRSVLDFFWGMTAALAYQTKPQDTAPARACPFADLIQLAARPLMRGFGQPIQGQDDLIQVILSGVRLLGDSDHPSLAKLRAFAGGGGVQESLMWAASPDFSRGRAEYWEEPTIQTYQGLLRQTSHWEDMSGCFLIDEGFDGWAWRTWQPSAW